MSEAGRPSILPKPVTTPSAGVSLPFMAGEMLAWVARSADLVEGARVEEPVDPLADGQLALGVLLGDRLRPAHGERARAPRLEILDQILHAHARLVRPWTRRQ